MPGTRYTQKEMIAKLVSFPTVSEVSNLDLIDFVHDYLAGWGVESHYVFNAERNTHTHKLRVLKRIV